MTGTPLILCVCTYNQTRSVIMAALLREHLESYGVDAMVGSAGTRAGGGRPLPTTLDLLAQRNIDVSDHRGTPLRDGDAASADLIITAEQTHVIDIASRWPGSFTHTFTLPELVERISARGSRRGDPIATWVERLNTDRHSGMAYLDDPAVIDVGDPTGSDRGTWTSVFRQIDTMTQQLARALST